MEDQPKELPGAAPATVAEQGRLPLIALLGLVILAVGSGLLSGWWSARTAVREGKEVFAVVDVTGIIERKKQALMERFRKDASDRNIAEMDRELIAFLGKVDDALTEVSASGGRILLKREAVVDGRIEDLTEEIERRASR